MAKKQTVDAANNQFLAETGTKESITGRTLRVNVDGWEVSMEWFSAGQASGALEERDGMTLVHFDLPDGELGEYHVRVRRPFVDIYRSWVGDVDQWRGSALTSIALNYTFETRVNNASPIVCNYNRAGVNSGVVTMLDQLPRTKVNQRTVIETPPMCQQQVKFSRHRVSGGFRETLVIYRKPVQYAQAVREVQAKVVQWNKIRPLAAPEWAREPVWCSWYSHLYGLTQGDLEAQIPHMKAVGVRTMLVDASWFKAPDVAYSHVWGDYIVHKEMIPDMSGLSAKVHAAGLKLMLWCGPLYVGQKAICRKEMEPYLAHDGQARQTRLCPFCPEAAEHASKLVSRLMREHDLDGLKLDFMSQDDDPMCVDPKHDHSLHEGDYGKAMLHLMSEIRDGILSVKPDAAIEYRIGYSTPSTLGVANCHRGNDAPYDADYIRRENQFLRLFCHKPGAVWSDYAYWHAQESTESVSLMLGQQVFSGGVPTLSIDFETLGDEHRQTLHFWMNFYREHQDALAGATLQVHAADTSMTVASLNNVEHGCAYLLLTGTYLPGRLVFDGPVKKVWVLNATAQSQGEMTIVVDGVERVMKITGHQPSCY